MSAHVSKRLLLLDFIGYEEVKRERARESSGESTRKGVRLRVDVASFV